MKKNFVLLMLFLLIAVNFFGIYILEFPFYQEILIVITISIILLSLVPEKYVFVLAINLILSYGLFLVIHAIVNKQTIIEVQMQYLFSHLLFTSIILICWILLNYIKKTNEEYTRLKKENLKLQKYQQGKDILTIQGFNEQVLWVLKDAEVNQTETWLLKLKVTNKYPKIKKQIHKSLEKTGLSVVRKHYDLIASTDKHIYIVLKHANQHYVEKITTQLHENIKEKFNVLEPPVTIDESIVRDTLVLKKKERAR